MKYEMRRSDRAISNEESLKLLMEGEYGILATCGADGTPYGVPLSYAFDGESRIYFHGTNEGGRRYDNVKADGRACFTVVGGTMVLPEKFSTVYESVIADGSIRLLEDTDEKKAALMQLVHKYSSDFVEKGDKYITAAMNTVAVYEMTIEHLSGKSRRR